MDPFSSSYTIYHIGPANQRPEVGPRDAEGKFGRSRELTAAMNLLRIHIPPQNPLPALMMSDEYSQYVIVFHNGHILILAGFYVRGGDY